MELAGRSVLVLGLGVSGRSAARFCAERGARVTVADERPRDAIDGLDELPATIERRLGAPFPDLADWDLVVPSPGIPAARWQSRRGPVWGDIELCGRALPIPIVAVTGTNGKSTVVRLIESLAKAAGLRARAAGNLGEPALDLVGLALDVAILEVSSFQLESIEGFRPRTAVWLNLSPDHLDRHGDLEGYRRAKARLFENQGPGDFAILNADDPAVAATTLPDGVTRLELRRGRPVDAGAWLDGRCARIRLGQTTRAISLEGFALGGLHNEENALAALLAVATLDADLGAASRALADFEALPHRCQSVARIGGVEYVDDSKATNVGAAARALQGFGTPIVWIAGGRHKGGDLSPLAASAAGRVRHALLIGEAAAALAEALEGEVACERLDTLGDAVRRAAQVAKEGDIVLLAPACASFDQFESFEDRGRRFQAAVHDLAAEETAR